MRRFDFGACKIRWHCEGELANARRANVGFNKDGFLNRTIRQLYVCYAVRVDDRRARGDSN